MRAVDELRDHVVAALADEEVVDDGDVRVMDLRRQPRLAQEARAEDVVREQLLLHHLDAAEGVEVEVAGLEDLAHAARADAREDLVLAVEHRSGPEAG